MEDNSINKPSEKNSEDINESVVDKIGAGNVFWNGILEFLMEFNDTKIYQWIKANPRMSMYIIIAWGAVIMTMFITFLIIIFIR